VGIDVAGVTLGATHPWATAMTERRFQLVDNVSKTMLAHTLKLGFDVSQTRYSINELANSSGTYYYSSLTAFAQDLVTVNSRNYSQFTQTFGNPVRVAAHQGVPCVRPRHLEGHAELDAERQFWLGENAPAETHLHDGPLLQHGHHSVAHAESDSAHQPRLSDGQTARPFAPVMAGIRSHFGPDRGMRSGSSGNGQYQTSIVVNPNHPARWFFLNVYAAHRDLPKTAHRTCCTPWQMAPTLQPTS